MSTIAHPHQELAKTIFIWRDGFFYAHVATKKPKPHTPSTEYVRADIVGALLGDVAKIANGEGYYGAQAREYKDTAKGAIARFEAVMDGSKYGPNEHVNALLLACNSAKNYILEHGDDRTMAPVIEQLEQAIKGTTP